ncbi:MAG: RsmB/NOP family class I SAM-dependent RNA methyltransferase [Saprospiraceae bacterium]|nr:RsmB/NOP family class I SAM-dependent RNA methyltransferase [Candidatus Brachybacter algidus]
MKARWSHCIDVKNGLFEIMNQGQHAEFIVKKYTSSPNKGSKDRKFISEALFTIVKNFSYYQYLAKGLSDHKDIDEDIINAYLFEQGIDAPDGPDWKKSNINEMAERKKAIQDIPHLLYSMPLWMDEIGTASLGEKWQDIRKISVEQAPIYIRINFIKTNMQEVVNYFSSLGIDHEVLSEDCILLKQRINLLNDIAYQGGWFEIQDMGSQSIGHFAHPNANSFVIDACAGGGGKALHLASLMGNTGQILALDINEKGLANLKIRARRAGADIIGSSNYSDEEKIKSLQASADLVLCDVPCSATGVMRREIDKKWRLTQEKIHHLLETQRQIMSDASKWVKPGGKLVYSTCSVFPMENEDQVNQFLTSNPDFKKLEAVQLFPESGGHDGFYMCSMMRS